MPEAEDARPGDGDRLEESEQPTTVRPAVTGIPGGDHPQEFGASDPPPRRGRTLGDWLRPDLRQTVIAVLLAAFTFAVVTQIAGRDQADAYKLLRQSDLVAMLDGLDQESQRLEGELASLREAQAELKSGQDNEELARQQAQERLTSLGILAGTVPAQGPGVVVTISDPQGNLKPGMLLDAIEEMRDAGAEAMQVNGKVRIVGSSWISSSPSGIVIDGQSVAAPITLEVIGDPHALEEAARFRGGLVSQVTDSRVGGQVAITRTDELRITALHDVQPPAFAVPVDDEPTDGN